MNNRILWFSLAFLFNNILHSQSLTGNYRLNMDFYDLDTAIAAKGANYEVNKNSANAWLQTIYTNPSLGFEASIRFDGHYNSILQNPPVPVSFYGIGNWWIKKKIDNLEVQAGYIYEQYGTGIALRTFEEKNLGIDNAIFGVKAKYTINDKYSVRVIAGTQKNRLDFFNAFVKGINFEGSHDFNDNMGLNFGASVVSRTLTAEDRSTIDNIITDYPATNYFKAPYNTYILSPYFTFRKDRMNIFFEGAYKTPEAIYNGNNGVQYNYSNQAGYNALLMVGYAKPSLGITFQSRYTQNYQFQSTAKGSLDFNLNNNRRLAFIAPINRQNSLRLPARFQLAPQELGELASSIDITFKTSKNIGFNINACVINSRDLKDDYYKEIFADVEFKKLAQNKLNLHFGVQGTFYNQYQYQREGAKDVMAYTFFVEPTYKFDRKKSIRAEFQIQKADKELGTSMFALLEFNIAPSWSFSVSDLWTFKPNPNYELVQQYKTPHHFYSAFCSYTKGVNRFTLAYVKQLAGIVCTGGVCRLEPAFSGVRMQLTSSF
jgi:hypothetical protein